MMKEIEYWNKIHSSYTSSYDGWLDEYLKFFNKDFNILELGAGRAYNSLYLMEKGYKNLIITDFSDEVLDILKKENNNLNLKQLDIAGKYPFDKDNFDVIIADLSLHYFKDEDMMSIIDEIKRILKPNGLLIARVNSVNDFVHIPKEEYKIHDKLYFDDIMYKRFFDINDIKVLFRDFEIIKNEEKNMNRYEKPKVIIEFCVRKK